MKTSWQRVRIADIAEVTTGGTPSTSVPEYWGGDIQWMSSGEVNDGYVYKTKKHITRKGLENSNARLLPEGSVMIALAGQGKTRGMSAILKTSATCNQSLAAILPSERFNSDFLYQCLKYQYLKIRGLSGGEGRTGLNLSLVKNIEVDLPTLREQDVIAKTLISVDETIAATKQTIKEAQLLKKILMQDLIKLDGMTQPLRDVVKEIGAGVSVRSNDKQAKDGELGILKTSAVSYLHFDPAKNKVVDSDQVKRLTHPVRKNTILVSRMNTPQLVGANVFIAKDYPDLYLPDRIWELVVDGETDAKWLNFVLQKLFVTGKTGALASGTSMSMRNISQVKYLDLRIPKISKQEQSDIANILNTVDGVIQINKSIQVAQEKLKLGLMQDLITGKVLV